MSEFPPHPWANHRSSGEEDTGSTGARARCWPARSWRRRRGLLGLGRSFLEVHRRGVRDFPERPWTRRRQREASARRVPAAQANWRLPTQQILFTRTRSTRHVAGRSRGAHPAPLALDRQEKKNRPRHAGIQGNETPGAKNEPPTEAQAIPTAQRGKTTTTARRGNHNKEQRSSTKEKKADAKTTPPKSEPLAPRQMRRLGVVSDAGGR